MDDDEAGRSVWIGQSGAVERRRRGDPTGPWSNTGGHRTAYDCAWHDMSSHTDMSRRLHTAPGSDPSLETDTVSLSSLNCSILLSYYHYYATRGISKRSILYSFITYQPLFIVFLASVP